MQLVNVLRGGMMPGSVLAEAVRRAAEAQVNSFHHQCVRDLGDGLRITATCLDVIEAVDSDVLAVQCIRS